MSALRINLLPAYIAETRNTKLAIAAFSALFLLGVAGSLGYYAVRQGETVAKEAEADSMEQRATAATTTLNNIKAEATALRAQIAPIKDRVSFVKQVQFYNTWVQKIYRRAAQYTDSRVEYSSMAVTEGTLAMTGYVSGESDPKLGSSAVDNLARYLITFTGNPDVTAVSVSGPPGWQRPSESAQSVNPLAQQSAASPRGFSFSVNATLLKALQRPALPVSLTGDPPVTEPVPQGGPPVAGTPSTTATGTPGVPPGPGIPSGPSGPVPSGPAQP